ncbi:ATP-binding cassette domain-containing protein [Candidatus Fermentibacteria bacterium]|nr:ATP-binding cassette domain-containing protein [Candidatus Fermentibacteria bacterium]
MSCGKPMLEVTGLRFAYSGCADVLRGIDLRMEAGERVGVVGPNGSGKTTLFLNLCGALEPEEGEVLLHGRPVRGVLSERGAGMVMQNPDNQLFCATVEDDVRFGPENLGLSGQQVKSRVEEALRITGMSAIADRPPHHLSGGEKRMVSIAGVLAMKPDILMLDEPASSLDSRSRRRLISYLQDADQVMMIASHDLELILETCSRAILLDDGRVVADDAVRALFADGSLMREHGLETPHSIRSRQDLGTPDTNQIER